MKATDQISKLIVDLKRQKISVFYHQEENEISPIEYVISRNMFTGIAPNFSNKLRFDLSFDKTKQIYSMEKECYSKIKYAELSVEEDFKTFKLAFQDKLRKISELRSQGEDTSDYIILIPNTLINKEKTKDPEADNESFNELGGKKDIIGDFLIDKNLVGKKLDYRTSENIKKEIIYNL